MKRLTRKFWLTEIVLLGLIAAVNVWQFGLIGLLTPLVVVLTLSCCVAVTVSLRRN